MSIAAKKKKKTVSLAKKSWNGYAPCGKHGADYEGQPCSVCPPVTVSTPFKLTRDMQSTTWALLDLRRGFQVWQRHPPYHATVRARLITNKLATLTEHRSGRKTLAITQAGLDALTTAGY